MKIRNQSTRYSLLQVRRAAVPILALGFGFILAACAAELDSPDLYKNALGSAAVGGAAGSPPAAPGGGPPAGTGGTPPSGTGGSPAVSDCWKQALTTNCEGCHGTLVLGGLDLRGGDAVTTRLVEVAASNETVANMTSCVPGALLIDPANPMNSVMYKRLKGTQDCGTKMPQVGMLNAADAKCLDDWILSF